MKGYIMLSEGRSGSNWLGSMANNTEMMGHLNEWLGREYFERDFKEYSADEVFDQVMQNARTENDRLAIKIFPRHIYTVYQNLGFDFIRRCMQEHETKVILLKRRDSLAQAI